MGGGFTAGVVDVIVCSDGDDDADDDVVLLAEFPAYLANRPAPRKAQAKAIGSIAAAEGIVAKAAKVITVEPAAGAEDASEKSLQSGAVVEDDDFCILDEDPWKAEILKPSGANAGGSDELVMTGFSGPVACRDYPHARHLCAQFSFETTSHATYCPQCHCYVCETRAPCPLWRNGGEEGNHCDAVDTERKWKHLRRSKRGQPSSNSDLSNGQQISSGYEHDFYSSDLDNLLTEELLAQVGAQIGPLFMPSFEQERGKAGDFCSADSSGDPWSYPLVSVGHGSSSSREQQLQRNIEAFHRAERHRQPKWNRRRKHHSYSYPSRVKEPRFLGAIGRCLPTTASLPQTPALPQIPAPMQQPEISSVQCPSLIPPSFLPCHFERRPAAMIPITPDPWEDWGSYLR